eukprot:scaffold226684_cov22-Tisochrysis_lutea.AAC.1
MSLCSHARSPPLSLTPRLMASPLAPCALLRGPVCGGGGWRGRAGCTGAHAPSGVVPAFLLCLW